MNKKGGWMLGISISLVIILIIILFFYFALYKGNNSNSNSIVLKNPVFELSDEQAIAQFNESFVLYLLYSVKANQLHNSPLSKDTPKIEIAVGEKIFNAEVGEGIIFVEERRIQNKDIIIRTNSAEAVKMLRDKNYISKSFSSGNSEIELVAAKSTLFAKGYLNMYTELTGKSVTGNALRIYTS